MATIYKVEIGRSIYINSHQLMACRSIRYVCSGRSFDVYWEF